MTSFEQFYRSINRNLTLKQLAVEFAKHHAAEMAKVIAEKAELYYCNNIHDVNRCNDSYLEVPPGWYVTLDKQSILTTAKEYYDNIK